MDKTTLEKIIHDRIKKDNKIGYLYNYNITGVKGPKDEFDFKIKNSEFKVSSSNIATAILKFFKINKRRVK